MDTGKITSEIAIGHFIQNLIKHETEIQSISAKLHNLRADIDSLATRLGVEPPSKTGKLTKANRQFIAN